MSTEPVKPRRAPLELIDADRVRLARELANRMRAQADEFELAALLEVGKRVAAKLGVDPSSVRLFVDAKGSPLGFEVLAPESPPEPQPPAEVTPP